MNNRIFQSSLLIWLLMPFTYLSAQSVADPRFRFKIERPRYQNEKGPLVLYDEGHNNPFTLKGQYAAFTHILEADGYQLKTNNQPITAETLLKARVFVTVNALHDLENWGAQTASAYTDEEVETLYRWVHQQGGSLFLITDQMPAAGAASKLAARFGFKLINGFAQRKDGQPEIFSRTRDNLTANPITDAEGFAIDSIRCWVGTGFIPPLEATIVSSLSEDYEVMLPSDGSKISGTGLANSAILQSGRGRVFLIADAAPFYAILRGIKSEKRGMNHPDATQNAQFLLNILHWLDTPY